VNAFLLLLSAASIIGASDDVSRARKILTDAARAYQTAPALRDTLSYVLEAPNAEREPKRIEIRLGGGKDVSVADGLLQAVAVDNTLYLTKVGSAARYAAGPYSGDFARALERLAGPRSSLFEPPQVAMRTGKTLDAWIDSLRFHQLAPLHLTRAGRVRDETGRPWDEIQLAASNGEVRARFDPKTHFFSTIGLRFTPKDAPREVLVEVRATLAPAVLSGAAGKVAFNPGRRRAVSSLAELDSTALPDGKPAPSFELPTLAGGIVSSRQLTGRVVLLDFWASWCAPCWAALAELHRVSDWAASKQLPVTVLTVNTLERFADDVERRARVGGLTQSKGLALPVLLDDGKLFQAFGSPGLPSSVVISPEGRTLHYHQGLEPDLADTLEREIQQALPQQAGR